MLGPDIVPKRKPGEYGFWAEISATDDDGVSVLVNSGDQVRIDSIAGLCSFSERKGIVRVLSIAGALATGGALPALAVPAINAMRKQVENASGSKKRDGFGEEVGGNKYARKEGGIVVFMPKAKGPIYGLELDADCETKGRLKSHNPRADVCFFPCRASGTGAEMARTVEEDGVVRILAFDSDYSDNAGSYSVRFTVITK